MEPPSNVHPPQLDGRRSEIGKGVLALLLVQVIFGLFPLFVKLTTDEAAGGLEPRALVAWRISFGAVALFSLALAFHGRRAIPTWREFVPFLRLGVLGVVLNQLLVVEGIHRTQVAKAGVLMCTIPIFTYGVALLLRAERFRPLRAGGIALALSGAATIVLSGSAAPELRVQELLGDTMIVANCLSFAFYLVLAKPVLHAYPPLVAIAWVFLAALWTVPFLSIGVELVPTVMPESSVFLGLAYTLILTTTLAYILNTYALARVSASTTATFIYLQPLIAGVAGYQLRGERLSRTDLIAAALLFAGLFLVIRPDSVARGDPALPEESTGA